MKENKKTTSKKTARKSPVNVDVLNKELGRDMRDAVLIISLVVNAYVLIGWLVLQVTTKFDPALISYLQSR